MKATSIRDILAPALFGIAVLILWQTSLIRGTRLRVIDEVANGLAYYDHTFLSALPAFYADLEDRLGAANPAW